MVKDINDLMQKDTDYKDIQATISTKDPTYHVPTFASLSRHYKNHFAPSVMKAVVWKNGQLCFEDGTPINRVSAIDYLEGIINLAARNVTARPHTVNVRDALLAVELLIKIRQGLDKLDEFEEAWTELLKNKRKKRTKKMTVEVTEDVDDEPELAALPDPVTEYEGFDDPDEE